MRGSTFTGNSVEPGSDEGETLLQVERIVRNRETSWATTHNLARTADMITGSTDI